MTTTTEQRHFLSVDGGCISTNIYLDQDDLRLIVQCLESERRRMESPTDSQCWALCDEREHHCHLLAERILVAGFTTDERVALRGRRAEQ